MSFSDIVQVDEDVDVSNSLTDSEILSATCTNEKAMIKNLWQRCELNKKDPFSISQILSVKKNESDEKAFQVLLLQKNYWAVQTCFKANPYDIIFIKKWLILAMNTYMYLHKCKSNWCHCCEVADNKW